MNKTTLENKKNVCIAILNNVKNEMDDILEDERFKFERRICAFYYNVNWCSKTHGCKKYPLRPTVNKTNKPTFVRLCENGFGDDYGIQIDGIVLVDLVGTHESNLTFMWGERCVGKNVIGDDFGDEFFDEIPKEIEYILGKLENADENYDFKSLMKYIHRLLRSFKKFKEVFPTFNVDCCSFCKRKKECDNGELYSWKNR